MSELILIIGTALFGVLLIGTGARFSWSGSEIVEFISYCFIGLGFGVVFYASVWVLRWLLLGGLVS